MSVRAYIAGPMAGYPEWNFPSFFDAEARLRDLGYETINPARIDRDEGFDGSTPEVSREFLVEAMRRDLLAILSLEPKDCVVCLPGWRGSGGARVEVALAERIGVPVVEFVDGCLVGTRGAS